MDRACDAELRARAPLEPAVCYVIWQILRGEGMQAHGRTLASGSRSFPGDECLRFEGGGVDTDATP